MGTSDTLLPLFLTYKRGPLIGKGTYGEVYLGEAPGGVGVALKHLISPLESEKSAAELASLNRIKNLRHPYLLQVQAIGLEDARLVIVMELADGSLASRFAVCREEGLAGIPAGELIGYLTEAAEALDYLNAQGMQHRDVKAENILLLHGHVKVADFGLAHALGDDSASVSFAGTPAFVAPEVWQGRLSPRSDQYSLAVLYAQMRTGALPFAATSFFDFCKAHCEQTPSLLYLSGGEKEAVLRALAKRPADRFESCRAFAEAVRRALPVVAPPQTDRAAAVAPRPAPVWAEGEDRPLSPEGALEEALRLARHEYTTWETVLRRARGARPVGPSEAGGPGDDGGDFRDGLARVAETKLESIRKLEDRLQDLLGQARRARPTSDTGSGATEGFGGGSARANDGGPDVYDY